MDKNTSRLVVIPARAQSSRFPRKVLATVGGKPLIQWVWELACNAGLPDGVIIATDCSEVQRVARNFGASVAMTPTSLPSGTDRVFYTVRGLESVRTVVNVQGDEPLLDPGAIDALITALESDPRVEIATLAVSKVCSDEARNPNIVKIRMHSNSAVIDFSRDPLPTELDSFHKHLGVYAFRHAALAKFCSLPYSVREQNERLEQLRALEAGMQIRAVVWDKDTIAVDVPEDIARVEAVLRERFPSEMRKARQADEVRF